ncbi:vitamin K epoxide reductase family protein [Allohahella marinimesophila]|uniref:NAD-dependent epimerase/dehydratase family protein n=1 Tax=Allohahella marinimesophila TaxID=1054972 RepID=A0ABP7NHA1_9GAMM
MFLSEQGESVDTQGKVTDKANKPLILLTGASGRIGSALVSAFRDSYHVIGLDQSPPEEPEREADRLFECDLTNPESIELALTRLRQDYGNSIAAVIHLAAYFDFTGNKSPLYDEVNVQGTRYLLEALQPFEVERFFYASTMLVHKPGVPGQKIDEHTPIDPGWAYPESKAETEAVIEQTHGDIPYTLLRLAGLYDDSSAVPTLSQQIARIYERDLKSHVYSGDLMAGQAFLHQDDMIDAFERAVERRNELEPTGSILIGEDSVMGYQALQNRIGQLLFGDEEWTTMSMPEVVAKPGAWMQVKAEPVVPDAIDKGEKPFIRPFMIELSSDHYDLDIRKARQQLGWQPTHSIYHGLEALIDNLKSDPFTWYKRNGITPPDRVETSEEKNRNAESVRAEYDQTFRAQHRNSLWAHFMNMALAFWLITAPFTLGYESTAMTVSDIGSGVLLLLFASLSLSHRLSIVRWFSAAVGLWLLFAPLAFWAPTAAAYMNGTLVGMMVMAFAILTRPTPGVSSVALTTGPTLPPGWTYNPSAWFQRLPIIILALVGFLISRYLCAYQLGHIDAVWDPFFGGAANDPKNGTEEIITSSVSEAWPVPDAGLGAMTYALEILTGVMGSARRWRTMPWLVMLFGIMIVPLGAVSIIFIIIQPIVIGTWCTLCLVGAAAMLIQIPYSIDELVATGQFLYRRKKKGRPLLRVFFMGDTDDGPTEQIEDSFEQTPGKIVYEMFNDLRLPWNLALCLLIGLWLMLTRLTLGHGGDMANADHLIGALVLTVVITALAEAARAVRFLLIPLGLALFATPFMYDAGILSIVSSLVCGVLLMVLSLPRGKIRHQYGSWNRLVV